MVLMMESAVSRSVSVHSALSICILPLSIIRGALVSWLYGVLPKRDGGSWGYRDFR